MIKKATIKLHKELREAKISGSDKCIFSSIILIGLTNLDFQKSYSIYPEKECEDQLKNELENAVIAVFAAAGNKALGDSIVDKFDQIYQEHFSKYGHSLFHFVDYINKNIVCNLAPDALEDVVSLFYHEFTSYSSGGRSSLGIVLTPEHIAGFMAEAINIDSGDTVLDICCGSGALLLAAHRYAKESENTTGLLVGCELDKDISILASINLIAQQRRASVILKGDSFTDEKSSTIRALCKSGFAKGLLNPPYAQKGKNELSFLLHELSFMKKGAEVAIICPTSCAIGTKFHSERSELMNHHTLKAVFTMPHSLFTGNGAAANTCVMIWVAHVPHNASKTTFFGYYTEDGFKTQGKKGRVNIKNDWNETKQKWLNLYREQKVVNGISTLHCVSAADEWLCEAYMDSDYNQLTRADFERTLINYLSYCVSAYGISTAE